MTHAADGASDAPMSWKKLLSDIPAKYRDMVLQYALAQRARLATTVVGNDDIERANILEFTPLSTLSYATFIPYHLVGEDQHIVFSRLLEQSGPSTALEWLNDSGVSQDILMIVGDLPSEKHMTHYLDEQLQSRSFRSLIAGPGTQIEAVVRSYASHREIPDFFVRSLDQFGCATWDASPGPTLDAHIERLFSEQLPTRLLAFAPVRLPSTQLALDYARQLGLPLDSIEANVLMHGDRS